MTASPLRPRGRWRPALALATGCVAAVLTLGAPAWASDWTAEQPVWSGTVTGGDCPPVTPEPHDALAPSGDGAVIWERDNSGTDNQDCASSVDVMASSLQPDGSWGSPATLDTTTNGQSPDPLIGMDAQGDATAVWVGDISAGASPRGSSVTDIHVATLPHGSTTWGNFHEIAGSGTPSDVTLAVGPDGTAVIAWEGGDIQAAVRQGQTGSWSAAHDVSSESALFPAAAVDAAGDAIVSWTHTRTDDSDCSTHWQSTIGVSWHPANASTWPAPEAAATSACGRWYLPSSVALDGSGHARVAFDESDGGTGNNMQVDAVRESGPGSGWSASQDVGPGAYTGGRSLVMDSAGHAVSGFNLESDGTVQAALAGPGADFGSPGTVATTGQAGDDPWLAMDAGANAFALWLQSGGHGLGAAVLGSGDSAFAPAEQVTGDDTFGYDLAAGGTGHALAVWGTGSAFSFKAGARGTPNAAVMASFFGGTITHPAPSQQQPTPSTPVTIKAPSVKKCLSKRYFHIHVWKPRGARIVRAQVIQRGHRVRSVRITFRHGWVNLRNLPKGTFTVRVWARYRGRTFHSITRTYHTCYPGRLPGQFG